MEAPEFFNNSHRMEPVDGPLIVEEYTQMGWGHTHDVTVITRRGRVLERKEYPPSDEQMWADNVRRRPVAEWWPWFIASAVPSSKGALAEAELDTLKDGVAKAVAAGESMGESFSESRDGGMYATMAVAEDGTLVDISFRGDHARLSKHPETCDLEYLVSRTLDGHFGGRGRCFFRFGERTQNQ